MRIWISFILLALIIVGVSLFVSRNADPVSVDLGFRTLVDVPLWMSLLGAGLLGAALAVAFFSWPLVSLRLRVRRGGKRITELEQEVHGLRTLPLSEEAPEPSQASEG